MTKLGKKLISALKQVVDIETKAKQIHDASEVSQKKIYEGKGYAKYHTLEWTEITPGFYRDHIYLLAQKALDDDNTKSNRKKRTVTKNKTTKVRLSKPTNRSNTVSKKPNRNNDKPKRARTRS